MKRRAIILIVLVLLAGIGWLVLRPHDQPRRALEEYKKQLIAQGEKLTIAELIPPPSNKTPNGANNFLKATNLTVAPTTSAMQIIAPGVALANHGTEVSQLTPGYQQYKQKIVEVREILKAAVLDFNLDYTQGFSLPLMHLAKLKSAELLASGTAVQALHANDHAEAWLDLNAAVDLIRLVENDVTEVSGLVRSADVQIAVAAFWEALQSDQWTDDELSGLQAKWLALELFSFSEPILNMERGFSIDTMIRLRTNYDQAMMISSGMRPVTIASTNPGVAGEFGARIRDELTGLLNRYFRYPAWKSTWSYEEEHYYLQILGAGIEAARRTRETGAFIPALQEFSRKKTNISSLFRTSREHFVLFEGAERITTTLLVRLENAEVARRLLVTAIVLKRFQLQHHNYPASLDELVPAFLPRVPADLMDGKPLRYRLRPEGGFLLYSVGEDGEDNGGDATPVGGKAWLQGRDIVWPRPATAAEAAEYLQRAATTNAAGK